MISSKVYFCFYRTCKKQRMGANLSSTSLPTSDGYKECLKKITSVLSLPNNEALVSCADLANDEFHEIKRMSGVRSLESDSKYDATYAVFPLTVQQLKCLRRNGEYIIPNASDAYNQCIRKITLARDSANSSIIECPNLSKNEFSEVYELSKVHNLHHEIRTNATFFASSRPDKPKHIKKYDY